MKFKKQILGDLIWAATKYGAFQRSNIYKAKSDSNLKEKFRNDLSKYLYENVFIKHYNNTINETDLYSITQNLIKLIHSNYSNVIGKNKFTYGNAQKFVNLYVKCMWMVGKLGLPPHFPVDSFILKDLKIKASWTKINIKEYREIIKAAKNKSQSLGYNNLAEWEADEYYKIRKQQVTRYTLKR